MTHDCPYCDRTFVQESYRDLHLGHRHEGRLTTRERAAFERAYEREEDDLTLFRYKALGLLVLVYFGFLLAYAVSL
ncbi:C2H2-type zinc finger protein [Halosegnis rubeus]|jgi:hypothetical protein|uniref:C2H2-type zinc finger protein n=1 Tax=Halosegnis rubeus TaxID=2212850 RepID=A0A5N5UAQ9_9EURY|nr:C2H2-type zinc finger protein [Halosegnis rubeus]KAB7514931.1 C2H2-type zinc finger protein [Halosegnis rubeus]KAB7518240.1 C2H2-type zinc finger protein [Halosegnis rubeus]KAB7519180.1 C2H2-type zinc finger protein [Halosegnis rubeus]